ncbi:DNA replication/repair protein RecF [Bacteroidota bacterium]
MKISSLRIKDVRNHRNTEIDLNEGLNVFYGLNGAGKTTVLESIAICGFSKSFLPVPDSSLINNSRENYNISARAVNDIGVPYRISVLFERGKRKRISSTFGDNLLAKDIIGEMPVVILSPDFKAITFGSPDFRRQFIDRLLSQASKIYIEELYNYRRALRQRNSLLSSSKIEKRFDFSLITPWTDVLIKSGAEIILRRLKFVEEFKRPFREIYKNVSNGKENVSLEYVPNGFEEEKKVEIEYSFFVDKLKNLFEVHREDEYRRGVTLFGPQKDDLKIFINGGVAREFASQGQHKSLLISLKLAEFDFLKDKKQETPVVLLDDIFSELDEERIKIVFDLVWENSAQTFITVANPDGIRQIVSDSSKCGFFEVKDGLVSKDVN